MPDREKVIKGLEMCLADEYCNGCPYEEDCFDPDIDNPWGSGVMRDALAILKEQEAVEPKVSCSEQRCGNCNKIIEMDGWKACPWCGKMIDWERWWQKNGARNQDT